MTPHTKRKLIHYWRRQIRPLLILILVFTACRSSLCDWNDVPTGSMRSTIVEGDRIYVNKLAYGLKFPFTTWHLIRWGEPQRGEIVVFYSPEDGTRLVKRVIGVPGDRIAIKNNRPWINGQEVKWEPAGDELGEPLPPGDRGNFLYFRETLGEHVHTVLVTDDAALERRLEFQYGPGRYRMPHYPFRDVPEFVVPAGKYFMMGDNRDNSKDARYFNQPLPYGSRPYDPQTACVPLSQIVGRSSRVVFSLNYDNYWLPRSNRWFKGLP